MLEYQLGIPYRHYSSIVTNGMEQTFINELQGNFYLRTPKREKPSLIYYVIVINGKKYRFATGVKVYPDQWNTKRQEAYISVRLSELDNTNNSITNTKIAEMKGYFSEFKNYLCEYPNEIENSEILLKQYIYKEKEVRTMNCIEFLNNQLETYNGASASTKKDYSNGIKNLDRYMKEGHEIASFDELDKKYVKGFYEFLRKIDDAPTKDGRLSLGYINKQISQLSTMLNKFAVENDVMKLQTLNEWNYKTWTVKDKATKNIDEIALRDDEVLLLWDYWHKIDDTKYKDTLALFLLECLTGQRYSDIDKVLQDIEVQNNTMTMQLVQGKTAKKVEFDIVFELTKEILAEYKHKEPCKVTVDYFNKLLKKIAKAAGIKGKQLITRHSGESTSVEVEEKERYECVKSHTGRRTFITLLKLRGWDNRKIQTYSGHETTDMVEHYTKIVNPKDYKIFKDTIRNNPEKILRYADEEDNQKLFEEYAGTKKDKTKALDYLFDINKLFQIKDMQNSGIDIYQLGEIKQIALTIKNTSKLDEIAEKLRDKKDTIKEYLEKIDSLVWNIAYSYKDAELWQKYEYKKLRLNIIDKIYTKEEIEYIWLVEDNEAEKNNIERTIEEYENRQ